MIVSTSNADFDVQTPDDVYNIFVSLGLDRFEIEGIYEILRTKFEEETHVSGSIDKDDYENACDGIHSEMNDILTECDNLDGPSKKNMTRKDIASRIRECCSNIESINGCFL